MIQLFYSAVFTIYFPQFLWGLPIQLSPCYLQIDNITQSKERATDWHLHFNNSETSLYKSPTESLGVWWVYQYYKKSDSGLLQRLTEHTALVYKMDTDCRSKEDLLYKRNKTRKDSFSDNDLKKLLKNSSPTLIYMWSPRMPHSIRGLKEIIDQQQTLLKGWKLVPLIDPEVSDFELENFMENNPKLKSKIKIKFQASFELKMRGMQNHYPTALYIQNGWVDPKIVPGLKTPTWYASYFKGKSK